MIAEVLFYLFALAYFFSTAGAPITIGVIWTVRTFLRKTSVRELICLTASWSLVAAGYAAVVPFLLRIVADC